MLGPTHSHSMALLLSVALHSPSSERLCLQCLFFPISFHLLNSHSQVLQGVAFSSIILCLPLQPDFFLLFQEMVTGNGYMCLTNLRDTFYNPQLTRRVSRRAFKCPKILQGMVKNKYSDHYFQSSQRLSQS